MARVRYVICTPEPLYPLAPGPLDPFLGFYKARHFQIIFVNTQGVQVSKKSE